MTSKIIYTHTDEAPLLATYSFLPIIQTFAKAADVEIETRDISLAGRVIAQFPDLLTPEQRIGDHLAELGKLALLPEANIIKLPNVSASQPQLDATIKELQDKGYALPDYPSKPTTDAERDIKARYDRIKGSAVNPVLREGNSDRRAPLSVKNYAKSHPHSMGAWSPDSKTNVATMTAGDFFSNEQSVTIEAAGTLRIEHVAADGTVTVLKASLPVLAGEVIDGTFMSKQALVAFLAGAVAAGQGRGRAVLAAPEGHDDEGLRPDHLRPRGPRVLRRRVRQARRRRSPPSAPTPTTASAPCSSAIESLPGRPAGRHRGRHPGRHRRRPRDRDGRLRPRHHQPARAERRDRRRLDAGDDPHLGPDVERRGQGAGHARRHPRLAATPASTRWSSTSAASTARSIPSTMGSVPNVGLMAQQAEEYGSHDKTFEIPSDGTVRVVDADGNVVMSITTSRPATSGACARPRTCRSRTG